MKKIFIILLLFIFSFLHGSQFTKIHVNKNHGLITFMESLSDIKYVSNTPKKIFYQNYHLDNRLLKTIKIHKKITRSRIYNHPKTQNMIEAFYLESINYNDFQSFFDHMMSYKSDLKRYELEHYFSTLSGLAPVYDQLIWQEQYNALIDKKHKLEKIMEDTDYDGLIKSIAKFYNIDENNIDPMDIALYPLPRKSGYKAFSIKTIESIGLDAKRRTNLKWLLSATILHEISHTIYYKSSLVEKHFIKNQSKILKNLYTETFATAIGAGWGYEKLSGKITYIPWYNNKDYDKNAKKIFPMIKKYLEKGKTMDKNLILRLKQEIRY